MGAPRNRPLSNSVSPVGVGVRISRQGEALRLYNNTIITERHPSWVVAIATCRNY